jgi:hypothetical protein
MKKFSNLSLPLLLIAISLFSLTSCQKTGQSPTKASSSSVNTAAFAASQAIVIAASSTDTIYAVNTCHPGDQADTVVFSTLPDTIGKYLTVNYSGYTFNRAYKILNHAKTLEGYVVVITFNGNPVGLSFNANGIFVNVLEQREGHDLKGQGWHEGGRFGDRDNHHPDTIALSALPAAVKTYFSSNYPDDTLRHALINRDSSYLVISADNGVFATALTKTGTLIKRVQLYPHVVSQATLTQAQLPATVSTYLTTTYPAYVFDTAFAIKLNGAVEGYLVFIEANSTKYLVGFDASGKFAKSMVIR